MEAVDKVARGRRWCGQSLNNLEKNMSRYQGLRLNDGILESESLQMGNYIVELYAGLKPEYIIIALVYLCAFLDTQVVLSAIIEDPLIHIIIVE
jgi:hypothetical protein